MELLVVVAALVVAFLVGLARHRAAVRRRRRIEEGHSATSRALLRVGEGAWRRGRLAVAPGVVTWHARGGGAVDLRGAEVLAASPPRTHRARADDILVRARLASGAVVEVVLHEADGALLARLLREHELTLAVPSARATPAELPTPRRRWPVVLLAVAALWAAGWAAPVFGGATVTATVLDGDGEGICDVAWADAAGRPHFATADCNDEPVGSPLVVWALGPPWTGEALYPAWSQHAILGVGGVLAAIGAVGLGLGRRERRGPGAACPSPAGRGSADGRSADRPRPYPGALPHLRWDDVLPTQDMPPSVLARVAPYAARQVPENGWEDERRPAGAGARAGWRDLGQAVLGPVVALAFVAGLTAPLPLRWYTLQVEGTGVAVATSTGQVTVDGWGPLPNDVAVRYTDGRGAEHVADVAARRALPEGETVEILYARDDPGVARIRGAGDGLPLGGGIFVAAAFVAVGVGVVRARRALAGLRLTGEALTAEPRPALATLTAAPDGLPHLLLADRIATPVRLTAVAVRTPLPHGAAAAFPIGEGLVVHVRGRLAPGEAVVTELPGGQVLRPAGPAWHPAPEDLLVILDSAGGLASTAGPGDAER